MKAVIAGAGTYGAVYHKYLADQGQYDIVAFLDDDTSKIGQTINRLPVISEIRDFRKLREMGVEAVFCPMGNNRLRLEYLQNCLEEGFQTPGFIHPTVIIPDDTLIGKGVYILPGSIIMPFVDIRDFAMISMGVKVAHHTILREASFLSTGVNMGASIDFGQCAFAGIGSIITTGIKRVGHHATIGAGAVIIRDVEDHAVMVGNPGRVLRKQTD